MATSPLPVQEFAARIKAKYPDYANIPDEELARKIIAKHPEYESQVRFDSSSAPKEGFWSALGSDVKGMAQGIPSMLRGAIDPFAQAAGSVELAGKIGAEDVLRQQEGRSLPYRAVAGAGTALGINARGMEEAANVGDTAGVLGHAALPTALALAGPAGEAVGRRFLPKAVPGSAAKLAHVAAKEELVNAVLKPPKDTVLKTKADFDTAMPNIAQAAGGVENIKSTADLAAAAKKAGVVQGQFVRSSYIEPLANYPVDLTPVKVAITDPVTKLWADRYPAAAARIRELANRIPDKAPVGQVYDDLVNTNAELEALMKKSPGQQRIAVADPEWGWLVKYNKGIRKQLYEVLPDEAVDANRLTGAIGHIRDLAEQVQDRSAGIPVKSTSAFEPRFEPSATLSSGGKPSLTGIKLFRTLQEGAGKAHPDARVARLMPKLQIGPPRQFAPITVQTSNLLPPATTNMQGPAVGSNALATTPQANIEGLPPMSVHEMLIRAARRIYPEEFQ